VQCGDDGLLTYQLSDGTTTQSAPNCVPILCDLAQLSVANADYLSIGHMTPGGDVNVTCNSGFKRSDVSQNMYTECSKDASFLVTCEDATCGFSEPIPYCKPISCQGLDGENLTTVDGLHNLSFSYQGNMIPTSAIPLGLLLPAGAGGDGLVVTCPDGYRVWPANSVGPNPPLSAVKSQTIRCPADSCTMPGVRCVRLTCGSLRMVHNGAGTRSDPITQSSASVAANDTMTSVLHGEVVSAMCDSNFKLTSSTTCAEPQNFSYQCDNTDVDGNHGFSYLGAFSSSTKPMDLQCEVFTCEVTDLNSENGVRHPVSGSVIFSKNASVLCDDGYLVKPQNVTRHPICGDADLFTLTCSGCKFPNLEHQPRCEARACLGTVLNMTEDGLLPVTYSYNGLNLAADILDGEYSVGANIKVECPVGYRVPTTTVTTVVEIAATSGALKRDAPVVQFTTGPSRPIHIIVKSTGDGTETTTITTVENKSATAATDVQHAMSVCTSGECGLSRVSCRRLACGNFSIPANSTGAFKGETDLPPSARFMMFNETLTVTCVDQYILSTSDVQDCASSFSVTCDNTGHFESTVPIDKIKCVPAKKKIFCADCRKTWGVGPDVGDPKFPDGLARLDCSVGHCDPPHGIDFFETEADVGGERCQIERGSTHLECLHVQCRPLTLPYLAEHTEIDGLSYKADADGIYPTALCGQVVRVYCDDDRVPEETVKNGANCTENYFNMTCDGRGFWTGYQKCVPKACVVPEEHGISFVLFPDETYDKKCPLGTEISRPDHNVSGVMVPAPLPVCQHNCQLNIIESCMPWNCSDYQHDEHEENSTHVLTAGYRHHITVRCVAGFAAFTPGVQGCAQDFGPVCQADKSFDRQSGQQCFPANCPAYQTVAQNIKPMFQTAMSISEGHIIQAQCKDEYANGMAYGFNQSSIAHSTYTIRGQATTVDVTCNAACEWSHVHNCVAVPCKCMTFADMSKPLSLPTDGTAHPIIASSESDATMMPSETKRLQCPIGFERQGTGSAGTLTCQNDCSLAISGIRCVPKQCRWSDAGFLTQPGVKVSPATDATMRIGETMTVECDTGFELAMEVRCSKCTQCFWTTCVVRYSMDG